MRMRRNGRLLTYERLIHALMFDHRFLTRLGDNDVYFILVEGFVKIGHSNCVNRRLSHVQTSCPYPAKLLGSIPGGAEVESAIHAQFREHHHRGEWFRHEGYVQEQVEKILRLGRSARIDELRDAMDSLAWNESMNEGVRHPAHRVP